MADESQDNLPDGLKPYQLRDRIYSLERQVRLLTLFVIIALVVGIIALRN